MSWDAIIGQQRVTTILRQALRRDRLSHAYIFSGAQGIGKDAVAFELAKVVNCENASDEACGTCQSCVQCAALQHPNVLLVFPLPVGKNEKYGDAPFARLSDDDVTLIQEEIRLKATNPYYHITIPKATGIKINSVREIRKESSLTLSGKGKRVFIIMNAEQLNDEASNALLKILEEPHEGTMLILTTSQPDKLLPTIISRCQSLRFDLLSEKEIHQALQDRERLSQQESALIARLAHGSYSRALELNGTQLAERSSEAVEFLRVVLYKSKQELLTEVERIVAEYERSEVGDFLSLLQAWLRNALLIQEGAHQLLDTGDDAALKKFSAHHTAIEYTVLFERMERAISLINKNVYIPLVLINLAIDLRRTILVSHTPASFLVRK